MKKIMITLVLFGCVAMTQAQEKTAKKTNNKGLVTTKTLGSGQQKNQITNKQAKARMQVGNKNNDKYLEKYRYQNNNQTMVCESYRGRRNHCRVDTRYGVNLVRQLSGNSCNYHWGYDETGIWVDSGCRAEFSINVGWDQPGAAGNIMVCESYNYQRNYCPAYLGGRDVFILRQISNSSCQNNWGYDRNGVWVTNGCRAEFAVEDRHSTQNDVVVCSSRNLQFQGCQADTRGGVEFLRQISRSSCNGNWGYDRQGIWVVNGCRAQFRILPYNNYGNNGFQNERNLVRCSSRNHQQRICPANTAGGVKLVKQRSRATCNGNWGYDRNSIWVTNGCRATFEIFPSRYGNGYNNGNRNNNGYRNNNNNGYRQNGNYNNNGLNNPRNNPRSDTRNNPRNNPRSDPRNNPRNNQGHHNNNGYNNTGNNYGNQNNNSLNNTRNNTIICESRQQARNACIKPAGTKVKLTRVLSNSSCAGNWGYDSKQIWVRNGCRAEFSVF